MPGDDILTLTFSIPFIDPADQARLYWSIDREASSASWSLVDAVVVGVQEGARARIRSPGGELDCLRCRQSNAVVLV
jgi:hypothetical protein